MQCCTTFITMSQKKSSLYKWLYLILLIHRFRHIMGLTMASLCAIDCIHKICLDYTPASTKKWNIFTRQLLTAKTLFFGKIWCLWKEPIGYSECSKVSLCPYAFTYAHTLTAALQLIQFLVQNFLFFTESYFYKHYSDDCTGVFLTMLQNDCRT